MFLGNQTPFDIYFQPCLNVYTCKGLSAILVISPNSFIALGSLITPEAFMISGKKCTKQALKEAQNLSA